MKRLTLLLLSSFIIGALRVLAATPHFTYPAPRLFRLPVAKHESPTAPVSSPCFPGLSLEVEKLKTTSYFPPGIFDSRPSDDKFIVKWYSKHLRAMDEPSLLSRHNSPPESYRFLWLRTFNHPLAVHVWRSGNEHILNLKLLNGTGGYKPGRLIINETRPLTDTEWDGFIRLLERGCYWQLAAEEHNPGGRDGAQWILEGRRESRYHIVDRWSPLSGDFREACLYLLKLAKPEINLSGQDIY